MTKVPENQGVSEGWQITLPPPVNNFGEQNCLFHFQPAADGLCRREKVRGRAAVFAGNARAPMIVRDFFPDKKSLQTMPLAERRRLGAHGVGGSLMTTHTTHFWSPFRERFVGGKMRASSPFGRRAPPGRRRYHCMVSTCGGFVAVLDPFARCYLVSAIFK